MGLAIDLNKTLPHDEMAERALLGAMLLDNKYVDQVFSEIANDDFYSDAHRVIATAIFNLAHNGQRADIVTVASWLEKQKELRFAGGHSFISTLVDDVPDNLDITSYLKIVKDRSSLRKVIVASMGIIQRGVEPSADTETLLNEIQEDIIKIKEERSKKGFLSTAELVAGAMDEIEKIQKHGESSGLKTGFDELDGITSGFQRGDLIIIAARPAMGKTALALNIAANLALREGKAVGFFSIEMSKLQIMMRILAIEAKIGMTGIRTGKPHFSQKEWHELELKSAELQKAKLFIDDSAALSIIEMKSRARRLKAENQLDILFLDYLQLIKVTGEGLRRNDSRAQEIAVITAALKELAKELYIPVVAMAQLNRAPETRGFKKEKGPKYLLSDLKESGSIEQDADVVIFLHREDQLDRETEKKGVAEVIVAKQRNGPTGKIFLAFIDKFTKFANLEYREKDYQ